MESKKRPPENISPTKHGSGAIAQVISLIASVKLTVTLFMLIVVSLIMGFVLPLIETSGGTDSLSPQVTTALNYLNLFDIYHSKWFLVILAALSVNIVACLLNGFSRYRVYWKKRPIPPFPEDAAIESFSFKEPAERLRTRIERILSQQYRDLHFESRKGRTLLYGERAPLKKMALYLVHIGVLAIIIGAVAGYFFGFEAYVEIPKGKAIDTIYLRKKPWVMKLDYSVRCDDFSIEYHKNGMPSEYRSELSFIRNGKTIKSETLRVNHPALFDGIRFYQSNYGRKPEALIRAVKGETEKRFTVSPGTTISLDGMEDTIIQVLSIEANLMNMGPAVELGVEFPDGNMRFYVLKNIEKIKMVLSDIIDHIPRFDPARLEPYVFTLDYIDTRPYTGVKMNKDPAIPFVVVGGLLFIVGTLFVFTANVEKIWVLISKNDTVSTIAVAYLKSERPATTDPSIWEELKQEKRREL